MLPPRLPVTLLSASAAARPAPVLFRCWPALLGALLAQALLLGHTYAKLLFHPGQYLIVDHYDGIKSYFSMASFLRQPLGDGALVRGHNYPFGEYLYYTDCAPLVVVPLHWLVQTVPALAPYGLYLYDVFVLGGLLLSTALLVLILRRLALPVWLAGLLAVTLPWLGPQTTRLMVGHLSLSYTPAMLLGLWAMQRLHGAWREARPLAPPFAVLLLVIVSMAWLHFYYLPILGGTLAFFAAGLLAESWRTGRPWRGLVLGTGTTLLAAIGLTAGLLAWLDPRFGERNTGSDAFDSSEWRLQFGAFFRGYIYNKVRFPFERTAYVPYESSAYLTGYVLFGLVVVAGLVVLRRLPAAARLPATAGAGDGDGTATFLKYMLLAGTAMAFIALGENIQLDDGNYVVHNYLNALAWLGKITDRVTQFRALGRFVWPFWWALVLAFSWYVARWRHLPRLRWALAALYVLLVVDTLNATHYYRHYTQVANQLAPPATEPVRQLVGWASPGRYQALLPVPYFHTGTYSPSGGPNLNLDPDDPHCTTIFQLGMVTGLPLMSHKAARAITADAERLYTVFDPGGPSPALLARLDARPILVFLDSAYYNGHNNYYRDLVKDRPEMRALFERTATFVSARHLHCVGHLGTWRLYEWYPKGEAGALPAPPGVPPPPNNRPMP